VSFRTGYSVDHDDVRDVGATARDHPAARRNIGVTPRGEMAGYGERVFRVRDMP